MRFVAAYLGLLLLAGCEAAPSGSAASERFDRNGDAEAFASTASGFDYRYAYRLPGDRVKPVLQSNADACDRLGPSRCRIVALRYRVGKSNGIRAVLNIKIDPAIARNYGDAVTRTVSSADGTLIDTELTGADGTSTARNASIVARLREQLRTAEAQVQGGTGDANAARARAARLQAALDAIAEVEAGQGQTLATAPVLITYESSSALAGLGSSDANFRNAGQTFEASLAQFLTFMAVAGPWLLAVIVLIAVLRWIVHGRGSRAVEEDGPSAVPVGSREDRDDSRNLIQRWFARDEDDQR